MFVREYPLYDYGETIRPAPLSLYDVPEVVGCASRRVGRFSARFDQVRKSETETLPFLEKNPKGILPELRERTFRA